MSVQAEPKEHQSDVLAELQEIKKWLRVIAFILADMHNTCPDDVYEDID